MAMLVLTEGDFEQVLGSNWIQRVRGLLPGSTGAEDAAEARRREILRALPSVLYRRVKDMAPWGMNVSELTITASFGGDPFEITLGGEMTFRLMADESRAGLRMGGKAEEAKKKI